MRNSLPEPAAENLTILFINPEIVQYNRKIIDYVVLHQYCHLKYKTHCKSFFNMLEKYNPNYKECEAILLNI